MRFGFDDGDGAFFVPGDVADGLEDGFGGDGADGDGGEEGGEEEEVAGADDDLETVRVSKQW